MDRPGLLAMLKDAARRDFDVILAWREDRFCRGLRSMLLVLETIHHEQVLLTKERQEFITYARVTRMNHEEFSKKIAVHYKKAARVERRETAFEDELNAFADLDFDASVRVYVQDLQADLEDVINANPQSDEKRHALFLRKRRFVNDLLEEVVIDGDRQIHVKFRADILRLVQGNKVT